MKCWWVFFHKWIPCKDYTLDVILELDTKNTIILDEAHAHCLWAALSQMAEVKKWQDKIDPGNPKA